MFHSQPCTDSAPDCGTIPQGKGREGKRKGSGRERYRNLVPGSSLVKSQNQVKSLTEAFGFGAGR